MENCSQDLESESCQHGKSSQKDGDYQTEENGSSTSWLKPASLDDNQSNLSGSNLENSDRQLLRITSTGCELVFPATFTDMILRKGSMMIDADCYWSGTYRMTL